MVKSNVYLQLSEIEINKVIEICNLSLDFFKCLKFVKRNLLKFDSDDLVESFLIEDSDVKLSKVIFKDDKYHYKIYFSNNNYFLTDVIYMYQNNILQNYTPELSFIKNTKNEIIGYKQKSINIDMSLVNKVDLVNFYKSFTKKMRNSGLCYFDISSPNLGFIESDNKKVVKLLDIDLVISANKLFPEFKNVPVSNVNLRWHKNSGMLKYQTIMKSLNLKSFELNSFYNKKKINNNYMEKHLFLIWNDSLRFTNQIVNELQKNFQICYIIKNDELLIKDSDNHDFLKEFYWNNYNDYKTRPRFTSKCIIIIVNDLSPKHILYNTSQRGEILVNENVLKCKHSLRDKLDNKTFPLCHASDDVCEFSHNLKIISKYSSINKISKLINYQIKFCEMLQDNKIKFLKFPKNISSENKKMWQHYLMHLGNNYTNLDLFCIDSSFPMALHNIRDAADLTYVCEKNIVSNIPKVRNHGNCIEVNSNLSKSDIIFNPEYHFYCNGIKCLNLRTLKMIKTNRNTEKDQKDCKLIEEYLFKNKL